MSEKSKRSQRRVLGEEWLSIIDNSINDPRFQERVDPRIQEVLPYRLSETKPLSLHGRLIADMLMNYSTRLRGSYLMSSLSPAEFNSFNRAYRRKPSGHTSMVGGFVTPVGVMVMNAMETTTEAGRTHDSVHELFHLAFILDDLDKKLFPGLVDPELHIEEELLAHKIGGIALDIHTDGVFGRFLDELEEYWGEDPDRFKLIPATDDSLFSADGKTMPIPDTISARTTFDLAGENVIAPATAIVFDRLRASNSIPPELFNNFTYNVYGVGF